MAISTSTEEICLVTLGMCVLDEIHFSSELPKLDVIGGSGVYCALGARLFLPPQQSRKLGWVIWTGTDFPTSVEKLLNSWATTLFLRKVDKPSTRGELIYEDTTFGPKKFRYTTEPLKIEPNHLCNTPLISSRAFHFLLSPKDAIDQVQELLHLRNASGCEEHPLIIWEPAPPSCLATNLATCLEAIKHVDRFSPNHIELAAFFGTDLGQSASFDRTLIEGFAKKILDSGIGISGSGTIVVRSGHEGCCLYSRMKKDFVWLPPYYLDKTKVIDATGAGNAFLGGFAVGFMESEDDVEAAIHGTVASSFALEQIGLPKYEAGSGVSDEKWNGESVYERLWEYKSRIAY